MIEIIFEPHATSLDNEQELSSGHFDVDLSPTGEKQARELGLRRAGEHFDVIFTSDLKRAYNTASIAFGTVFPIRKDARLRECDYGTFEHQPTNTVNAERSHRIHEPFPNGESYSQRAEFMRSFLEELLENHDGDRVLIIGHRATQYGLERWVLGKPLTKVVTAPWHWQPGWTYQFYSIQA